MKSTSFQVWRLTSLLISITLLNGCESPAALEEVRVEYPTPTLFGTVSKEFTSTVPTSTIVPTLRPDMCVFPIDVDGQGISIQEAALYRYDWIQGTSSQVLETRDGPVALEGSVTTPAGERQLVIIHHAPLPESFNIIDGLSPGGTMLYDPGTTTSEIRDSKGRVTRQIVSDPSEDVRGLHPNLDITGVERQFSKEGGFIVRVTLTEPDDGKYIWTFETVELLLGNERFAERTMHTGEIISIHYDPTGNYDEWSGTMVVQANTITWALENGGTSPFGARSSTSAATGDTTSMFPVDLMQRLWHLSHDSCG